MIQKRLGVVDVFFEELSYNRNYLLGFFLLHVMEIGVICCAYKISISKQVVYDENGHPDLKSVSRQKDSPSHSFDATSEKQKRKELKKGMLIVSFHRSTQQFHHDALNALSEFMKTSPVKVLIKNSKDLRDVEPHKLVILFVDFNNRNIILENEDTEIGSLRNDTTKVFLSLKCDVFVVYCKDKGSQDLPPNNLYNPTLQSIEEHPVLSELKRNNRVLTINDKFHPRQVELLKKSCQQL
uniref:Uncharacterized protein LOC111122812 isoform X2 n=1 Tax=Crassostrea virginica TaxID=6565 RepID=A0A8B8CY08_CRAVI|nr:uncharacterized protein LOC111122812 isoform X2 [Crassostrea virginica]